MSCNLVQASLGVADKAVGKLALVATRIGMIEAGGAFQDSLVAHVPLLCQHHRQHGVAHRGTLAQGTAAATGPFEVAARQTRAECNHAVHLILSEVQELRGGDSGTKDAEHRTSVEATR